MKINRHKSGLQYTISYAILALLKILKKVGDVICQVSYYVVMIILMHLTAVSRSRLTVT